MRHLCDIAAIFSVISYERQQWEQRLSSAPRLPTHDFTTLSKTLNGVDDANGATLLDPA
jgi:hypothetical protein